MKWQDHERVFLMGLGLLLLARSAFQAHDLFTWCLENLPGPDWGAARNRNVCSLLFNVASLLSDLCACRDSLDRWPLYLPRSPGSGRMAEWPEIAVKRELAET